MIPNLQDLPPIEEDEHRLKQLLKPVLTFLLALLCCGGLVYLYLRTLRTAANQETLLTEGLQSIGADLWLKGGAREISAMDPDLITELARLRGKFALVPQILALPADPTLATGRGTHDLIYMSGNKQVLSIQLFVDPIESKVDILGWSTNAEFQEAAPR